MKRAKKLGPPKVYVLSYWYRTDTQFGWEQHKSFYYKRRGYPVIIINNDNHVGGYYNITLVTNHEHS